MLPQNYCQVLINFYLLKLNYFVPILFYGMPEPHNWLKILTHYITYIYYTLHKVLDGHKWELTIGASRNSTWIWTIIGEMSTLNAHNYILTGRTIISKTLNTAQYI